MIGYLHHVTIDVILGKYPLLYFHLLKFQSVMGVRHGFSKHGLPYYR